MNKLRFVLICITVLFIIACILVLIAPALSLFIDGTDNPRQLQTTSIFVPTAISATLTAKAFTATPTTADK